MIRHPLRPALRASRPAAFLIEPLELRRLMTFSYSLAFTSEIVPAHVVNASTGSGSAKFTLTNLANNNFSPSDKADVRIYARPLGVNDNSQDQEIGHALNQSLNLAVPNSKPINIPKLTIPGTLAAGDYTVVAIATTAGTATSISSAATGTNNFTVDPQNLDASFTILSITSPTNAISGLTTGTMKVKITNVGNIITSSTESALATAQAEIAGSPITLKQTDPIPFGNVKPQHFKMATIKFTFPGSMTDGTYTFQTTGSLASGPENNMANNTQISAQTVTITQGHIDLAATLGTVTLPTTFIAGNGSHSGSVQLKILNAGNIPTSATESATITVVARPTGGGSDIPLPTLHPTLGVIKANNVGNKSITIPLTFASDFTLGTYSIVVTISDDQVGADTNASNDTVTTTQTFTVAVAAPDVKIDSVTPSITGSAAGGVSGTAQVKVENIGNVPASGIKVDVYATQNGTIDDTSLLIGSNTPNNFTLNPTGTSTIGVLFNVPDPTVLTSYILVARLTATNDVALGNNTVAAGTSIDVAATPSLLALLPMVFTFTETSAPATENGTTTSSGTFQGIGSPAAEGTYSYGFSAAGSSATLTFLNVLPVTLNFTNLARPTSLNGKTITFTRNQRGTDGQATIGPDLTHGILVQVSGFFYLQSPPV